MVSSNLTNSVILWFAWLENNYKEDNLTDLAFECLSKYSLHLIYICLPRVWLFFLLGVCSKSLLLGGWDCYCPEPFPLALLKLQSSQRICSSALWACLGCSSWGPWLCLPMQCSSEPTISVLQGDVIVVPLCPLKPANTAAVFPQIPAGVPSFCFFSFFEVHLTSVLFAFSSK